MMRCVEVREVGKQKTYMVVERRLERMPEKKNAHKKMCRNSTEKMNRNYCIKNKAKKIGFQSNERDG